LGPLWIHLWLLPVLVADVVAIDAGPVDPRLETIAIESCSGALGSGSCRTDRDSREPADWFARVIWTEPEHLRARIEIRRGARDAPPSSVRTVEFSAADEPAQRERAVGLIIAAFVMEHARAEGTEGAAESTAAAQPPPLPPPEIEIAPDPAPRAHAPVWGVDLALLAGPGFDRGSPRMGAMLRGLFRPFDPPLAVVLGIRAARRWNGEDPSVLWLAASTGLALRLQTPARPLAVEARAELQLQRVQVEAEDPATGAHDSGGASRLGGALGLEAHVALGGDGGSGVSLFAGGEITALFPSVYLEVGGLETGIERNLGWGALVGLRVAD
jgi:hypothetical protein